MRVALIAPWYFPDSVGGTERYVQLLASDLRAMGVHVSIAAASTDEREHSYLDSGVEVYRYPVSQTPSRAEVEGRAPPEFLHAFRDWLTACAPDVVHMHAYTRGCGFWHALAVHELGVPLVATVHTAQPLCARGTMMRWGDEPCEGLMTDRRCTACSLHGRGMPLVGAIPLAALPPGLSRRAGRLPRPAGTALGRRAAIRAEHDQVRVYLSYAERIVALAEWIRQSLLANGVDQRRIVLSRHGLPACDFGPPDRSHRGASLNALHVGFLGRITPLKGLHILVDAVQRLPSNAPVTLDIYGTAGPDDEAYARQVRHAAGIDPRIRFHGNLADHQRYDALVELDLLAVPSLCLETGPLVVLEAFAAGTPVMGSRLGGIAELVRDGVSGALVEPAEPAAWSAALACAVNDPLRVASWRAHLPVVRSSSDVAREMLDLYHEIAAAPSACL